jgi:hypothetical protein
MTMDTSEGFPCHWLGLALPTWLAQAVDPKSQISSTSKSGRYTSQARIIQIAQSIHTLIYIPFQVTFLWTSWSVTIKNVCNF